MTHSSSGFSELNLAAPLVKAVTELGYETVLPIQAACIPPLLAGRDVLGLAQTGTGKTGAFALPLLSRIDLSVKAPQVLVLLAVFVLGLTLGVLLMVPKWWREHRQVRRSRTHPSPPNEPPKPKLNEADPHGV